MTPSVPFLQDLSGRWQSGLVSREQALYELSSWEEDLASRTDEELEAAWALRQDIEGRADIAPGAAAPAGNFQPLPNEPVDSAPLSGSEPGYSTLPPQDAGRWEPPPIAPPLPRPLQSDAPVIPMRAPSPGGPGLDQRPDSERIWYGAGPGTVSVPPAGGPSYIDRLFEQALAAYQAGQLAGASELLAEVERQQPGYSRNGQSAASLLAEITGLPGRGPSAITAVYPQPRSFTPTAEPARRSWAPWVATMALLLLVGGGVALWSMGVFGGRASDNPIVTPTRAAGGGGDVTPTGVVEPTQFDPLATPTIFGGGEADDTPTSIVIETPTPEPSSTVPPPPDTVTPMPDVRASTIDKDIRLREGPAEEYGILALYPRDTPVRVLAVHPSGEWVRISVDTDGRQGWMMTRWLTFSGDTSRLPLENGPGAEVSTADAVVNNAGVRLCEGPGYSFPVVWQYDSGAPLRVLAKNSSETWLRVEMMMPDRKTGWMERQYLRVVTSLQNIPTEAGPTPPGGKVTLEDERFVGGCAEGCRAASARVYNGSTATWIYGGSRYNTMTAAFDISGSPSGAATLTIRGLDSEDAARTPIRIIINGYTVYDGASPFPDDDVVGPGGPPTWDTRQWGFDASILRDGQNSVAIYNLSSTGGVGKPPFFMLDYAVVEWGN